MSICVVSVSGCAMAFNGLLCWVVLDTGAVLMQCICAVSQLLDASLEEAEEFCKLQPANKTDHLCQS